MTTQIRAVARRFHHLLEVAANRKVPQLLGVTMALVGLALGLALVLIPGAFADTPVYRNVFNLALPQVWGTFYLVVGVWLGTAAIVDTSRAQLPSLAMSILHCIFSLLTIGPAFSGDGLPTPIILFMGLSATCLITQLASSARTDHR
jgi:hypothetical protein